MHLAGADQINDNAKPVQGPKNAGEKSMRDILPD